MCTNCSVTTNWKYPHQQTWKNGNSGSAVYYSSNDARMLAECCYLGNGTILIKVLKKSTLLSITMQSTHKICLIWWFTASKLQSTCSLKTSKQAFCSHYFLCCLDIRHSRLFYKMMSSPWNPQCKSIRQLQLDAGRKFLKWIRSWSLLDWDGFQNLFCWVLKLSFFYFCLLFFLTEALDRRGLCITSVQLDAYHTTNKCVLMGNLLFKPL